MTTAVIWAHVASLTVLGLVHRGGSGKEGEVGGREVAASSSIMTTTGGGGW